MSQPNHPHASQWDCCCEHVADNTKCRGCAERDLADRLAEALRRLSKSAGNMPCQTDIATAYPSEWAEANASTDEARAALAAYAEARR